MTWYTLMMHSEEEARYVRSYPQPERSPRPSNGRTAPCSHGIRTLVMAVFVAYILVGGCSWFNLGKWRGIETVPADEKYYLLQDILLTASSVYNPKDIFDHNMHETVNLVFIPRNEKNHYVAESIWYDPDGVEFKTIRVTYDKKAEQREGIERSSKGTSRIHTIPTRDLFNHKPGMWKVALKLDGELARKLTFTIR